MEGKRAWSGSGGREVGVRVPFGGAVVIVGGQWAVLLVVVVEVGDGGERAFNGFGASRWDIFSRRRRERGRGRERYTCGVDREEDEYLGLRYDLLKQR